jgi:DNA-directed RNA polymerase specialized sigma subunit
MQHYIELTNSEIERRITEYIHSERDRKIMQMKLIDGLTYERIAEAVEMSPRQIKNIVKSCSGSIMHDTVFTEICFS